MAVTHHFWYKARAEAFRRKADREGYHTSMSKTKSGYSVSVWRD